MMLYICPLQLNWTMRWNLSPLCLKNSLWLFMTLWSSQMDGNAGHSLQTHKSKQHCLKLLDILTGLVHKPINSIKGSCHRQCFAAVVIAGVVSAVSRQLHVKLICGMAALEAVWGLTFSTCNLKGCPASSKSWGEPPRLLWDSPRPLLFHLIAF